MRGLFTIYSALLKKAPEEDAEQSKVLWRLYFLCDTLFQVLRKIIQAPKAVLFVVRVPLCAAQKHETGNASESAADKVAKNTVQLMFVSPLKVRNGRVLTRVQALGYILEQIAPQIYRESDFIADFLQINDAGLTFADYAGLDNYFRRQAARSAGLSQSTAKLVRGAMDLIFGFLPTELKQWIDTAIAKDAL